MMQIEMNFTATPQRKAATLPDLTAYDRIIVSTSAGKDSQAMMTAVHRAAVEQGVADRLVAVHADLGRVEWEGTAELARQQAEMLGIRFEIVKRPQGDLLEHIEQRGMFPSSTTRYCTSDHKRGQIAKVLTKLSREIDGPCRFLQCLGFRAEESPARAKRIQFGANVRNSSKTRQVDDVLPIHDWSTEDVWSEIEASGLPHHRAYDLGMPRLSCVFCIFAPKAALKIAGRANPELLDAYVEVEERIGHTFRKELSLAQVRDEIAADAGADDAAELASAEWSM